MTAHTLTPTLIRPKMLIRTARIGARSYRRERDLTAAIPSRPKSTSMILSLLRTAEQDCETQRRNRSPAYKPAHHVQVLAALIAETRQAEPA